MKPLLFPFTVISRSMAEALADGFGVAPVVAAPSRRHLPETIGTLADKGLVEVVFPASGDDRLDEIQEQFYEWARLHPSDDLLNLAASMDAVPFYDESKPSRIRSEILDRGVSRPSSEPETLTAARVLLLLAQEADMQAEEVEEGLYHLKGQQRTLAQTLMGPDFEDGPAAADTGTPAGPRDPGIHQPRHRIRAWSRLTLEADDPSPLWVTPSRAVFDEVLEMAPSSAAIIAQMPFPDAGASSAATSDSLWDRLAREDCSDKPIEGLEGINEKQPATSFRLLAALIPDCPPPELLRMLAGLEEADAPVKKRQTPWRNTLVTCVTSGS
ncbi:MAG: hypothetical protein LJE65_02590 [Desulfobacteraceae bacterium]|nr:hypothetical protein [Desulfobacteraceae bacterium]